MARFRQLEVFGVSEKKESSRSFTTLSGPIIGNPKRQPLRIGFALNQPAKEKHALSICFPHCPEIVNTSKPLVKRDTPEKPMRKLKVRSA
jgi:hypothetical protein